jgi:Flp pilus assembly protein TadG
MFAIGIIPIIGFVGVSVDYSRLLATRTAMQAALDATALLMSKEASTLTPEQVTAKGQTYFAQQFNRPEAKNVNVTATVTPGAGSTPSR